MSQSGDGADVNISAAQDVATIPPVVNVGSTGVPSNPSSGSRPPSIHDAASSDESSLSDEDEGEMSEARRRRKEKMKEKIEKKARKLMKQRIKEEKEKHPFFGMHQVSHNYSNNRTLLLNFNPSTWVMLRTLMVRITPSGPLI